MYIRQLEMEKYVNSLSGFGEEGKGGAALWVVLTRTICRIDRLRKKMKESQDYMKELDKHLYVVLKRG